VLIQLFSKYLELVISGVKSYTSIKGSLAKCVYVEPLLFESHVLGVKKRNGRSGLGSLKVEVVVVVDVQL
jgi:hypothetical protein